MNVSRRQFLLAGAGAVVVAGGGCARPAELRDEARRWLGKPTARRLDGPLAAPHAEVLDAVSHVLNRLTFGPRPGDHARVTAEGIEAFVEAQLAPELEAKAGAAKRLQRDIASSRMAVEAMKDQYTRDVKAQVWGRRYCVDGTAVAVLQ